MIYNVFDNNFKKIGTVQAEDADHALQYAKARFPFTPAPMVAPTNNHNNRTPDPLADTDYTC